MGEAQDLPTVGAAVELKPRLCAGRMFVEGGGDAGESVDPMMGFARTKLATIFASTQPAARTFAAAARSENLMTDAQRRACRRNDHSSHGLHTAAALGASTDGAKAFAASTVDDSQCRTIDGDEGERQVSGTPRGCRGRCTGDIRDGDGAILDPAESGLALCWLFEGRGDAALGSGQRGLRQDNQPLRSSLIAQLGVCKFLAAPLQGRQWLHPIARSRNPTGREKCG